MAPADAGAERAEREDAEQGRAVVDLDGLDPDRARTGRVGARPAPAAPGRPSRGVVAAVALGVLLAGAAVAAESATPAPATREPTQQATQESRVEASSILGVLSRPVAEGDALAASPGLAAPEVRPGSSRALAQTSGAQFWAALDDAGRVCLVTLVAGTAPAYRTACSSPADFAATGERVTLFSGNARVDAWLLSDSQDRPQPQTVGYVSVGPNLLLASPGGSSRDVPRRGGPTG